MNITFRWFGEEHDSVDLWQIKQIPGINGVVSSLVDIPVGDVWSEKDIEELKNKVLDAGLELEVIESVNIHEDIKLGVKTRDKYIYNYIETIKNLSKCGIKVICYNFMPVFDWLRSDLAKKLEDNSTVLSYDRKVFDGIGAVEVAKSMEKNSQGFCLPGWEAYRLTELKEVMKKYEEVDEEKLFSNLEYFLNAVIPTCEKYNVKLAIHPDDPPWSVFGLPRIVVSKRNLDRICNLVDSEYNGLTLCSGSLGVNAENNIPDMVRYFGGRSRIHFAHVRNVKIENEGIFHETSHLSKEGSLDLFEIVKAYYDIGFKGYIRPDHGRMIWNEKASPGYGLYDRALGIAYINGLLEAINKMSK